MGGRQRRRKGHDFERSVARVLREKWPDAVVRRSSQAEAAENPDVFVEGGPPVLATLWLELQDAVNPRPLAKLAQADRDRVAWMDARPAHDLRLPVVVWHRIHSPDVNVTTRLWVLDILRRGFTIDSWSHNGVVTMSLDDFLACVEVACERDVPREAKRRRA
jgi:hypothetical protein